MSVRYRLLSVSLVNSDMNMFCHITNEVESVTMILLHIIRQSHIEDFNFRQSTRSCVTTCGSAYERSPNDFTGLDLTYNFKNIF